MRISPPQLPQETTLQAQQAAYKLQTNVQQHQTALDALHAERASLQHTVQQTTAQLHAAQASCSAYKQHIEELQQQVAELQAALDKQARDAAVQSVR